MATPSAPPATAPPPRPSPFAPVDPSTRRPVRPSRRRQPDPMDVALIFARLGATVPSPPPRCPSAAPRMAANG